MPAERAAWMPGSESSTTVQAKGCSFMRSAACRKRSGNGLPRGTSEALKMRPSKTLPQAGHAQGQAHLVERARARDAGRDACRLDRVDRLLDAGHRLQPRRGKPCIRHRPASSRRSRRAACGRARPRQISTQDFIERPIRRRILSSTLQSRPCALSAREKHALASGSLSTSTPSQSKMTSTPCLYQNGLSPATVTRLPLRVCGQ